MDSLTGFPADKNVWALIQLIHHRDPKLNKRPNMKAYVVSVSNHLYLIWEILTLVLILPALGKRVLPELSHASISAAAL